MNNAFENVLEFGTPIYVVYSGSKSYGTNITEELAKEIATKVGGNWEDFVSDIDIRGVFIPHRKHLLGSQKIKQFEDPTQEDTMFYSLQRFLQLALECNPNIVELLTVDEKDIIYITEEGRELRSMAKMFFTKNAYARFGSYAFAQLKKLLAKNVNDHQGSRKYLIDLFDLDTKAFMHHERLTDMGIEIMNTGCTTAKRPNAKQLLDLRFGIGYNGEKITIEYIQNHAEKKQKQLEEAMVSSTIPEVPDFDAVNKWAIKVTDRIHGIHSRNGFFKGDTFNILPLEYEMIDKTTLLLVSNPLVRRKNKSQAQGFCIPHKDWYTGLYEFKEFKFEETTIEEIHKFTHQVRSCNPRHIDILFAGDENVLYQHPMAKEFKEKLKTLPTTKSAFYKAKGYIVGNLKKMYQWEQLKEKHNKLKQEIEDAKKLNNEYWKSKLDDFTINMKDKLSVDEFRRQKSNISEEYRHWQELIQRPKLNFYPDIPKNTTTESASMMGKYSYDTLTACDITHVARMFIELIQTGTIVNSRAYEPEMYAIKHGQFKTFSEFEVHINSLLNVLEETSKNSVLNNHKFDEFENWLIDFISRYHETLTV